MKKLTLVVRILFGLMLLVFGIIETFKLHTMEFDGEAQVLMDALVGAGYFLPIVGIIEILAGISLITSRLVPLAMLLMLPISINILLFHIFLHISTIPPAIVIFLLNVYLLSAYAKTYRPLLQMQPTRSPHENVGVRNNNEAL